jgi:hypothetical protein
LNNKKDNKKTKKDNNKALYLASSDNKDRKKTFLILNSRDGEYRALYVDKYMNQS